MITSNKTKTGYNNSNHDVVEENAWFRPNKKDERRARLFYASYHQVYHLAICRLSDQLYLLW